MLSNYFKRLSFTLNRGFASPPGGAIAALGKGKKKGKALGAPIEKVVLPVETDTHKLVKFCCGSNIYNEGTDVELKPDSEYPDWLWKLNTGKRIPLDELDPNTLQYWKRVRKMGILQKNRILATKPF
uniref:Large ribosomal subunit protein mL54 n=1 Tax=Clastoptera arizonana TaxID=38151 RepID=A0A1B6E4V8_9HEMI